MKCQITCHGRTATVQIAPEESLLEAAIKVGLEPPYSCLEGICGTCSARLESGEVISSEENTADPQNAIVKTCMARPRSDIVINYDNL